MFLIIRKRVLYFILLLCVLIFIFGNSILIMAVHKNISEHKHTILIEVDEKRLYLFEDGQLIKAYIIASGAQNTPSPIGTWKIKDKGKWGKGFGGYWMGLDVPWGTYGIHGTTREWSIGRAASHGCIRMYNKDIEELYNTVQIDTPVLITNGTFGPFGTGFRDLKPGDRGSDVLAVQERLKELCYFDGNLSGIYGENLKNAVNRFQADNSIIVKDTITREDYGAMGLIEFE